MGPKKGKDFIGENYWRTTIEEALLDDDTCKVKVILIEASNSDQDRIYLNKFEKIAADEKRFVIKNICKTEIIFMVNQLGGEKKIEDHNLRVFEEGYSYIKDKKDIPPDILALIIKHLILKKKEDYLFIKRQKLELTEGMRRESSTMIDKAEIRSTITIKLSKPTELPSAVKEKNKKREPELMRSETTEEKKYNTLLRIRGEEWRDKVYVEDYPTDGPDLYVVITGFLEPHLPSHLVKIGIPLTAIVQIRIDPNIVKIPSSLLCATKRSQSQTDLLSKKSWTFWEDLRQLRINRNHMDYYKNIAFIVFSPPYWDTERLSGSSDKIYDEISFLMYDIQDLTRQHIHYLENMELINIPIEKEDEHCNKYYQQHINDLPLESVTIYSILDGILQAVSRIHDEKSYRSSLSTTMAINHIKMSDESYKDDYSKTKRAENFVKEVFSILSKNEKDKKIYNITHGEECKSHKDPIIINYGNFVKNTTFHLEKINLDNIVWSTLFGMPIHKLWHNQNRHQGEFEAKLNFHINVLLSCFDRDIETTELNRLIHILMFRKLYNNRSSLKKRHVLSSEICDFRRVYLKRSLLAVSLLKRPCRHVSSGITSVSFPSLTDDYLTNDSYTNDSGVQHIKFLFEFPGISDLVSATEIANNELNNHMIDNYELFEDFFGITAFQILFDAFNKYNSVDYKYCDVTDSIVMMFFNTHDKDGIASEEWRCHLTTPLCFQDFFDFILEEQYDWIQNEEKKYDESLILKSSSIHKDNLIDPFAKNSCVNNTEFEMDLLIEGSLKCSEISHIKEPTSETTGTKYASSRNTTTSPTSIETNSKSRKKAITMKHLRHSILSTHSDNSTAENIIKKPFSGFDLGDRRVEVIGRDSFFFSKDGSRVTSHYSLIIPTNSECITLNLTIGSNEFWFYKSLGEYITSKSLDMCDSFRITNKDSVMINIIKQSYQVPLPSVTTSSQNTNFKQRPLKLPSNKPLQHIYDNEYFHSLFITWPNGLITESVYENNTATMSHVKQYHIKPLPHLDEEMRCISLKGEVIIFKISGDIEVLRPDSTYIKITKCKKNIIMSEVEKQQKGLGKEKHSKASSKSSEHDLSNDDKFINKKLSEYELIIEEFEHIHQTGIRQKWVNGVAFDLERLLIRTATDYCLGEIFSRRMDGTNILLNKDGVQVVTFPDNTRIITSYVIEEEEIFPEWTKEEKEYFNLYEMNALETNAINSKICVLEKKYVGKTSSSKSMNMVEEVHNSDGYVSIQIIYTVEHTNFTTVTVNKSDNKVSIDSPNDTRIVIDVNNHYDITLDNFTCAKFDGELLTVNYKACPSCNSNTVCEVQVKSDFKSSVNKINTGNQYWLKIIDSFSKKAVVYEDGSINIDDQPWSEEILQNEDGKFNEVCVGMSESEDEKNINSKPETTFTHDRKCRELFIPKAMKFFVLRRDLGCSELVHRSSLEEYKQACQWAPWYSINHYDTFGDHRSIITILTPVNLTESEKWLMTSKFANKPQYLNYKDLKKDSGKGFYHWMRPYERFEPKYLKPDNVLPPRLPRAFVLRTLEQQWNEEERANLKGARELLEALLRYRHIMQSESNTILNIPVIDPRSEEERRIDEIIQDLSHRTYEDLKERLAKDVKSRAKPDITTKPINVPEEMSIEKEQKETTELFKVLEDERESLVREVEAAVEVSPKLKDYWRHRAEEYKEEQLHLYLLREKSVPPYFCNALGGAVWWGKNSPTSEEATKTVPQKMECVCPEEDTSKTDD